MPFRFVQENKKICHIHFKGVEKPFSQWEKSLHFTEVCLINYFKAGLNLCTAYDDDDDDDDDDEIYQDF